MLLPTFPQGTEEAMFNLLKQVKTASESKRVQGGFLEVSKIKQAYEEKSSVIYDLLHCQHYFMEMDC